MRIKTLIKKLQAIELKHGNIDVHFDHDLSPRDEYGQINAGGGYFDIDNVKAIPYHYCKLENVTSKSVTTKLVKTTICNLSRIY